MITLVVAKQAVWIARYDGRSYVLMKPLTMHHIACPSTFRDVVGCDAVADVWERAIAEQLLPTITLTVSGDKIDATALTEHGETIDIDLATLVFMLKPAIAEVIPVLVEEHGGCWRDGSQTVACAKD